MPMQAASEQTEDKSPAAVDLREPDVIKGLRVVKDILDCTDEQLHSRQFILKKILEFGIARNPHATQARWTRWHNSSRFGVIQYPTEFADFIKQLLTIDIETAVEIGVYWGASSYMIAAFLQRMNPKLKYTMVDINDSAVAFGRFSKLLNLEKLMPATSQNLLGQSFDFVFIDADHSYMGAKGDWLNVGRYAHKAVAFHDIHGHEYDKLNGGVVRAWNEIKDALVMDHSIFEFAHSPVRWMGIGLAVKDDGPAWQRKD
nr:class I SAM-dependent methyltransferase [uncultured Cohaesibacter sp.]